MILLCIYVDVPLITGNSIPDIEDFKAILMVEFDMTDLGKLNYFLRRKIIKDNRRMILHQHRYGTEILKKFNMEKSNFASTPTKMKFKIDKCSDEEESVDNTLYKQTVDSLRCLCNSRLISRLLLDLLEDI